MTKFFNDELTVLQLRALECESSDFSSRDKDNRNNDKTKPNKDNKKSPGSGGGGASGGPPRVNLQTKGKYIFCGVSHPSPSSDLFNCRKFLVMCCRERGNLVRKLHFCLQCLSTKTLRFKSYL